jgi:membrane-associated HD superfamily phosphohydrolase
MKEKREVVEVKDDISTLLVLLQIVFLVLKLTGTINWPWVYILIPSFIYFGLSFIIILFGIFVFILLMYANRKTGL